MEKRLLRPPRQGQNSAPQPRRSPQVAKPHPGLIVQRARSNASSLTSTDVLTLQRTAGNQATIRLLGQTVQRKPLTVGPTGDRFEQEADQVAEQVVQQRGRPRYVPGVMGVQRKQAPTIANRVAPQRSVVQAKFMPVTKKMPWVRIYSGDEQPNPKISKATINHLFSRTLEVDPSQSHKEGKVLWVRARVVMKSGKTQNEGWIKWSDVKWAEDVIPEFQHQIGDKYFGLAAPSDSEVHNTFSGYAKRKENSARLYSEYRKNRKYLDKVVKDPWYKFKSKDRKLAESKLEIGKKLHKMGNVHKEGDPPTSNKDFINSMDTYLSIPNEFFSMFKAGSAPFKPTDSESFAWQKLLDMNPQDREMMASIKRDPNWTNRNWFSSSSTDRNTGHRSKMALRATIKTGHHVHFLLDGVNMNQVVDPRSDPKIYTGFTSKELRHLYRYWDEYKHGVTFWKNEKPVPPPWQENPGLWSQYDSVTRRESLDD